MNRIVFVILLICVSSLFASHEIPTDEKMNYQGNPEIERGAVISDLAAAKIRAKVPESKLSTELQHLVGAAEISPIENVMSSMENLGQLRYLSGERTLSDSEVYVYVYFYRERYSDEILSLVSEIQGESPRYDYLAAWVRTENLIRIAESDQVRLIRPVMPPYFYTGSVTTQGDAIHRTAEVRSNYGQGGSSIRVGVITDGVDSRAEAQATGDLPDDGVGLFVLQNDYGGDEGTALLEIIHDMVPESKLYFHDSGSSTIQFTGAVDALLAEGCNVICDDVGWLLEPFFEHGAIAQHFDNIVNSREDVVFTSSSGNAGQSHYQGWFYPLAGDPAFHDFSGGTSASTDLYLHLDPGENVIVVFQWNDPFGNAVNDYDIYLYSIDHGLVVSGSTFTQSGEGSDPLEYFIYEEDGTNAGDFAIWVHKYTGVDKLLEVFIYPGGDFTTSIVYQDNISPVDAIFGHAAVEGVIATGAVHTDDLGTIAPYSSQGPTTHFDYSARGRDMTIARNTPFVVGTAGVYITGAGGFGQEDMYGNTWFFGTSASVPHSASLWAQLWSETTPTNTNSFSITNMVSGSLGSYDPIFGYGLSDAQQSFEDWLPPPSFTSLHTPDISGDDDEHLQVNIVTGPGTTTNLFEAQIRTYLQGLDQYDTEITVDADIISPIADNSVEAYFHFPGGNPFKIGYHQLYLSYLNQEVSRTVGSTHQVTDGNLLPLIDIVSQDYDDMEQTMSFTIVVSNTGNTYPTGAGMLLDGINESGTVSPYSNNFYQIDFENIPSYPPRESQRDIGDYILYVLFGQRDYDYNLAEKVVLESSPYAPQNVRIVVSESDVTISWDEVPDCTYSIYSTDNPYAFYLSWDLEAEGLTDTFWQQTESPGKKFYFVKAVKIE